MKNIFRLLATIVIAALLTLSVSCSHAIYNRLNNPNGQYVTDSYASVNFSGIDYPEGWQAMPHNESGGMTSANFTGKIGDNTVHVEMTILTISTYYDFVDGLKQEMSDRLLYENLYTEDNGILFSIFGGKKDNEVRTIYICRLNSKSKQVLFQPYDRSTTETWIDSTCPLILSAGISENASAKEQETFHSYCLRMISSLKDSPSQ